MNLTKALGAAGALLLAALVGGTLIGSALANDATDATDPGASTAVLTGGAGAYCDVFLDTLASELGTTREGLTSAGRTAALAAVDAAVDAGDLDEERATEVRERIEQADGDVCGLVGAAWGPGFGHGFGAGMARGLLGGDVFEAAADALGIASEDLVGEFRDTGSLEALAGAQGVAYDDVKAAILAAVQADLDAAVAEGLPQERADAAIERLTAWLEEGGQADEFRFGPGGHHGPGGGPWRGPHGGDESDGGSDDTDA